jgi:hypothetical protein
LRDIIGARPPERYVLLQLGPAWETVLPGDLELSVAQGGGRAGTDEILGLVTKMSEIRAFGKLLGETAAQFPRAAAEDRL